MEQHPPLHLSVVTIEKRDSGHPRLKEDNFTFYFIQDAPGKTKELLESKQGMSVGRPCKS